MAVELRGRYGCLIVASWFCKPQTRVRLLGETISTIGDFDDASFVVGRYKRATRAYPAKQTSRALASCSTFLALP